MKHIEQIKDEYGNLMQLWGIYEQTQHVLLEEGKFIRGKKKLLATFESLAAANKFLKKDEPEIV